MFVTPVGFELVAKRELDYWLGVLESHFGEQLDAQINVVKGGLEAQLPREWGFAMNFVLKVPTRILMRLAEFDCENFKQLKLKIAEIPWVANFSEFAPVVKVSSFKSKLFHKHLLKKTATEELKKVLGKKNKSPEGEILLRIERNKAQLSIDTSGEMLFKRGYKIWSSKAPIRENLASGLLMMMLGDDLLENIEDRILIDPMCGSGTFLGEGYRLFKVNNERNYFFESFSKSFVDIKKIELLKQKFILAEKDVFSHFIGWEKHQKTYLDATKNLDVIPKNKLTLQQRDCFDANSDQVDGGKESQCYLVSNLPYGERIKLPMPPREFLNQVRTHLQQLKLKKGWVIFPRLQGIKAECFFVNGGLPVAVFSI